MTKQLYAIVLEGLCYTSKVKWNDVIGLAALLGDTLKPSAVCPFTVEVPVPGKIKEITFARTLVE